MRKAKTQASLLFLDFSHTHNPPPKPPRRRLCAATLTHHRPPFIAWRCQRTTADSAVDAVMRTRAARRCWALFSQSYPTSSERRCSTRGCLQRTGRCSRGLPAPAGRLCKGPVCRARGREGSSLSRSSTSWEASIVSPSPDRWGALGWRKRRERQHY